jgi:hypothetical protein
MFESFLIGVIVTGMLVAAGFFVRFWRQTHDLLFLAFSTSFVIEALNRFLAMLFLPRPEEGHPAMYLIRLFSYLLILAAIVHKNRRQ